MMLLPSVFDDNFFDDFFDTPRFSGNYSRVNNMRSDIKELDNGYQIDMQLPGYDKDDVKIGLKDGYLTVSADHNEDNEEKDKNGKYIRKECFRGSCQRSFYVGDDMKSDDIKASFKNGMLTIDIPKPEQIEKKDTPQLVHID